MKVEDGGPNCFAAMNLDGREEQKVGAEEVLVWEDLEILEAALTGVVVVEEVVAVVVQPKGTSNRQKNY